MVKGMTCPSCGDQKWHQTEYGGRRCGNCGVVGWAGGEAPSGGGGTGATCHACGNRTLHRAVPESDGKWVRRCSYCGVVVIQLG